MTRTLLAGTLLTTALALPALAAPAVVATIQPVHSLTAAVMDGIGEPTLLLPPGASPHAYSLKPSEAAALEDADLVVWIGDALETFLARTLDNVAGDAARLGLLDAPGMTLLDGREGGAWDAHDHDHDHEEHGHEEHAHDDHGHDAHDHDAHDHGDVDAHVWLAPANGIAMTRAIAAELARLDPAHAERYRANAERRVAALEELAAAIEADLAPVREAPFIVFHDAYQYFEAAFDLNGVGAVTLSPERQPGPADIAALRDKIERAEAVCVFAEPQFPPRLVETLVEGTPARMGVLDPVGAGLAPGPDAYPTLLRDLADDLRACLAGTS